ncbi:MAG: hypothetical protein U5R06_05405 [candidate division KSB1 bacterium]|nr:hypothetical protein [candidate division KSB1 bacterium]
MRRRKFLKTSAGLIAIAMTDNIWSIELPESKTKSVNFKTYRKGRTLAPVTKVTPDDGFYIHTFYDECPWSPNQRYLVVSKLPYQKKETAVGRHRGCLPYRSAQPNHSNSVHHQSLVVSDGRQCAMG